MGYHCRAVVRSIISQRVPNTSQLTAARWVSSAARTSERCAAMDRNPGSDSAKTASENPASFSHSCMSHRLVTGEAQPEASRCTR